MAGTSRKNAAIIGSGFIGRAWAIAFARAGCMVRIFDQSREAGAAAVTYVESVLDDLAESDLLLGSSAPDVRARISIVPDLAAALADVDHVQENTPEALETKKKIFAELDRLAPEKAIIASSTSALVPSSFMKEVPGRARCIVVHPINPPYLIPAVEIVPSPWTSAKTVEETRAFMTSIGQAPMVMKKEIDGFIMNRMQGALLEEAFRLVADGVCSAEDVDIGIREGLALRWSFMGPFETIDLNAPGGVRDYVERYERIYIGLFPSMQRRVNWGGPVLTAVESDRRAKVPAEKLIARQRWRDRRLMGLLRYKRQARREIGE